MTLCKDLHKANIRDCASKRFVILSCLLSKLSVHGPASQETPKRLSCSRNCTFIVIAMRNPMGRCKGFQTPACFCPSNVAAPPFVKCMPFFFSDQVLPSSPPELLAYIYEYSLLSGLALLPPFKLLTLLRNPPPLLGSAGPPIAPSLVILLSSIPPVGTRLGLLVALARALI